MPSLISPVSMSISSTRRGHGFLVEVALRSEGGAEHGQIGVFLAHVLCQGIVELLRDAHQLVRRHGQKHLRGGVAGRGHAVDLLRYLHRSAHRVGERARGGFVFGALGGGRVLALCAVAPAAGHGEREPQAERRRASRNERPARERRAGRLRFPADRNHPHGFPPFPSHSPPDAAFRPRAAPTVLSRVWARRRAPCRRTGNSPPRRPRRWRSRAPS